MEESSIALLFPDNIYPTLYAISKIDFITLKALHAALGASIGAAANLDDPMKGAAGGVIGAAGAEMVRSSS